MNLLKTFLIWLFLNIMIGLTMDFALFTQTTAELKDSSIFLKMLSSEFWASIEWMFVVPAQRIGNTFLNPAQLALSSYVFDFLSQLWTNAYWLNLPTTVDDYTGMIVILTGMTISKLTLLG